MTTLPVSKRSGFTIIEVVVFISVFTLAIVAIIAIVSYSGVIFQDSRHKVVASRYSEELTEWLKFQREANGFLSIYNRAAPVANPPTVYCFNSVTLDSWPGSSGNCSGYGLGNFFKRELSLQRRSANEVSATVVTSWYILQRVKSVTIDFYINRL